MRELTQAWLLQHQIVLGKLRSVGLTGTKKWLKGSRRSNWKNMGLDYRGPRVQFVIFSCQRESTTFLILADGLKHLYLDRILQVMPDPPTFTCLLLLFEFWVCFFWSTFPHVSFQILLADALLARSRFGVLDMKFLLVPFPVLERRQLPCVLSAFRPTVPTSCLAFHLLLAPKCSVLTVPLHFFSMPDNSFMP